MPVTYRIDVDLGRVHTRCIGNVTFAEVQQHFRDLESDPSLPERLDVLLDLRETESAPDGNQISAIAGELRELQKKVKWGRLAIVATRDVLYGMSRMLQVHTEGHVEDSKVVRELETAEAWLDAPLSRKA
jgi:hypothetical protein